MAERGSSNPVLDGPGSGPDSRWTGTERTVSESDRAGAYQAHARRTWIGAELDRCRTGRLRVGQSESPTRCGQGPEPDPRPSCQSRLGLGLSRTRCQTSVTRRCWDCRQAGGNQQGRGTQSRRSCPMGPDSDGFIMNRLEEGALGDPVLAGNLVYNLDGRRRHS